MGEELQRLDQYLKEAFTAWDSKPGKASKSRLKWRALCQGNHMYIYSCDHLSLTPAKKGCGMTVWPD